MFSILSLVLLTSFAEPRDHNGILLRMPHVFLQNNLGEYVKQQEKQIHHLERELGKSNHCNLAGTIFRNKRADTHCYSSILGLYKQTQQLRSLDREFIRVNHEVQDVEKKLETYRANSTNECEKELKAIGIPRIVLRFSGDEEKYNTWMKDSGTNEERIWVTRGYGPIYKVHEYASESHLNANDTTIVYNLPIPCKGTGHVVYKGSLYCNKWNDYYIIKYNFKTFSVDVQKSHNFYFQSPYAAYYWHHQDGKPGGIDLAVDEMGLWAISATTTSAGADLFINKLDPDTLAVLGSWRTSMDRYQAMDAFMRCGTLYGIYYNHFINTRNCYYFRYDTKISKQYVTCTGSPKFPPFRDNNLGTPMKTYYLNYNPMDKTLHASTLQHFLSYQMYMKR